MKKLTISNTALFLVLVTIAGCNAFFEKDISGQTIKLLSPINGTTTEIASQTFWWEKVEGAANYRLQIVSPSFDATETVILDTLISKDKFMVTLDPSGYEWRVRAENSIWQTQWMKGQLQIYSILEKDISGQTIKLLSPITGTTTEIASQTFWWEKVEGATYYRLQIVSPSFDATEKLILDTLVSKDKFMVTLDPSGYEWRVRAENSAWQTQWMKGQLQINTILDITRKNVNLLYPGLVINTNTIRFQWDNVPNAKNYSFVVHKDQWDGDYAVTPTLVDTTFLVMGLSDGKYVWGVKAQNSMFETPYSQKNLMVDATAPLIPVLISPSDIAKVNKTLISFQWKSSDLTSGIAQDTLKVFSDSLLTKLVKSVVSESQQAQISFTDSTAYYWTVRSVDKFGNVGATSKAFRFTIK
jgi:hypothetical protein